MSEAHEEVLKVHKGTLGQSRGDLIVEVRCKTQPPTTHLPAQSQAAANCTEKKKREFRSSGATKLHCTEKQANRSVRASQLLITPWDWSVKGKPVAAP